MLLSGKELSPRERAILHSIVRAYIDTGEPVGSRTISRMRSLALSPATIRNVMADLADDGYLAQPHTSAGRIPTGKAFPRFRRHRACAAAARRRSRPHLQGDAVGRKLWKSGSVSPRAC